MREPSGYTEAMCKLSDKLKLCTCDASVADLVSYWVFYRFIEGKNHMVIGRVMIRDPLDPEVEAHNRSLLLARLNESDAFDVDLEPRDGDRLQLTFRLSPTDARKTIIYGYAHAAGRWVEEPYDNLGWQWHHDQEQTGEVRYARSP